MRYVLLTCFTMAVFFMAFRPFQDYMVSGFVKDPNGLPITGVTVFEKQNGQSINGGTATGADGSFSLTVSSKNPILVFQSAGYQNQEYKVKDLGKIIQVILRPVSHSLNEVVVMGYGIRQKKDITGSTRRTDKSVNRSPVMAYDEKQNQRNRNPRSKDKYFHPGTVSNDFNTEEYDGIVENRFLTAEENPLSTFSIDVDGGSYSNVRRFIRQGQLPPFGAVRIEELINYFHYEYPQPEGDVPFSINTEMGECAWNPKHELILIGLQGKKIPVENLPASNLVFLIDVSGSMMNEKKLPLVQRSLKMLVDQLREQDRVSLVVYAGNAGLVMPSTPGSEKKRIKDAIDRLEAGGSTAGGAGIQLAYKVAEQNFAEGGNNRVILCTDGDFNVGPSSDSDLERIIEKEKKSGVFLTVLGYGMGNYKDSKMEKLADKGNGNHAYIDNESEARKVLVTEFGGTLFTIAKDVKLQIEFNPAKAQAYRLIGYENRMLNKEDFNNDTKDAGELGSGHTVTAIYEIIPVGIKNDFFESIDSLKYQQKIKPAHTTASCEIMTVKFRFKNPAGEKSRLIEQTVTGQPLPLNKTSVNFRFASAVAQFGMLLRNSEFKQQASFNKTYSLAKNSVGTDREGYRAEFLTLITGAGKIARAESIKEDDGISGIK